METIILKIDSSENAERIAALLSLLKGVTQISYVKDEATAPNKTTRQAISDAQRGKTTKAENVDQLLELLED